MATSVVAQAAERRVVLRVVVSDSASIPIIGADVSISIGTANVGTARTGPSGQARLVFTARDAEAELIVRSIGYLPKRQRLRAESDSLDVTVSLTHVVAMLDAVRSRARMPSNNYILGAAEIARSDRAILDAYDAIRDLRPQLLGDRMRDCPYVQNLWVNGVRQPVFPSDIVPFSDNFSVTRNDGSGRPPRRVRFPVAHAPPGSPLGSISPSHIAEMRYVSCHQSAVAGIHSVNALFIVLKAGVAFDLRHGSYVADSGLAKSAGAIP